MSYTVDHSNNNLFDSLYNDLTEKKNTYTNEINNKNQCNKQNNVPQENIITNNVRHLNKKKEISNCDDLTNMLYKLVAQFNIKMAVLIFIFYILYNTDIFNKSIISKFQKNTYNNDQLTEKGLITIGVLLSFTYIFIDVLNNNGYI